MKLWEVLGPVLRVSQRSLRRTMGATAGFRRHHHSMRRLAHRQGRCQWLRNLLTRALMQPDGAWQPNSLSKNSQEQSLCLPPLSRAWNS